MGRRDRACPQQRRERILTQIAKHRPAIDHVKGRGPTSSLPQYLHRSDACQEPGNHTDGQTFKLDNATTLQAVLKRQMAGPVRVSWMVNDQKLSGSVSDVQNGRIEGLPILQALG